jgi:hypothetical protein
MRASWIAVGLGVVLRRARWFPMLWVCVCATLSVGTLVLAEGARAGLHPDPPKLPQRPPPPPPPPAVQPAPAPAPATVAPPAALPPPPAQVTPEPAPAAPTPTRPTRQARAIVAARAARARAHEQLRVKERLATRTASPVRTPSARRPPTAVYTISRPGSHTGAFLTLGLAVLAAGLMLLGLTLGSAEALPWPQPARILVERRGEITFAGLGILASCSAVALVLLFAS